MSIVVAGRVFAAKTLTLESVSVVSYRAGSSHRRIGVVSDRVDTHAKAAHHAG
ncbi:hypothetical protein [Nocardia brasiliensis]|uniref:hypothetical protein n=1 Tax=Nocardia brasiliensis TaxID=37326 RepID=UPI00366F2E37